MQNISYDDLIYLVIGVGYLLIRYIKKGTPVQPTTTSSSRVPTPQSIVPVDRPLPNNKQVKEPVSARFVSPTSRVSTPAHATRSLMPPPAGPCTARQKIAYMLRQHGSLKKAIMLHEIIRVHDS